MVKTCENIELARSFTGHFPRPDRVVDTVRKLKAGDKIWERHLNSLIQDGLQSGELSPEAVAFIEQVNSQKKPGRMGYFGVALYAMNAGAYPAEPIYTQIYEKGNLFLFAIRVVDDWFDEHELEYTLIDKANHLDHLGIEQGTRKPGYLSPKEEAAVYLLKASLDSMKGPAYNSFVRYMNLMYEGFLVAECREKDQGPASEAELRERNYHNTTPFIAIVEAYSDIIKPEVYQAVRGLSDTFTLGDGLSDLKRDYETGASNSVLEIMRAEEGLGQDMSRYETIWRLISSNKNKYYQRILHTLWEGGQGLKGIGRDIYLTVGYAGLAKYFIEFEIANRPESTQTNFTSLLTRVKDRALGQ